MVYTNYGDYLDDNEVVGLFAEGSKGLICKRPHDLGAWLVPAHHTPAPPQGVEVIMEVTGAATTGRLRFGRFVCLFSDRQAKRQDAVSAKKEAAAKLAAEQKTVREAARAAFPKAWLMDSGYKRGVWKFSFVYSVVLTSYFAVHHGEMTMDDLQSIEGKWAPLINDLFIIEQMINDKGWAEELRLEWTEQGSITLQAGNETWQLDESSPLLSFERLVNHVWPNYCAELASLKAELAKIPFLRIKPTTFGVKIFNAERLRTSGYDDGLDSLSLSAAREYLTEWNDKGQAALEKIKAALADVTLDNDLVYEQGRVTIGGAEVGSSPAIARAIYDAAIKKGLKTSLRRQVDEAKRQGLKMVVLSRETCDPMGYYDDRRGRNVNGPICWEIRLKMGEAEFAVTVGETYLYEPEPGIYEYAKSASA